MALVSGPPRPSLFQTTMAHPRVSKGLDGTEIFEWGWLFAWSVDGDVNSPIGEGDAAGLDSDVPTVFHFAVGETHSDLGRVNV